MKKRNILIGVLVLLIVLGAVVVAIVLSGDNKDNVVDDVKDDNVVELTDDEKKKFDTLNNYGKEIYNNSGYVDFSKSEDGIYYATIEDLEKLGYDVTIFDKSCNKKSPVIYFDIDHKLVDNYIDAPISFVIECPNEE